MKTGLALLNSFALGSDMGWQGTVLILFDISIIEFYGVLLNFVSEEVMSRRWVERHEPASVKNPGVLWIPYSN